MTGLGLAQSPSFLNTISRGFAYLTEAFIIIGLVALIAKKSHFRFERDYTILSAVALAFLVSLTVVPGLANTLNMTRFYHILLMLLAPFCVIGMWTFLRLILKQEKKMLVAILIVAVLVPYFLFQSNFVYEVAHTDSWSIPLSEYRMPPDRLYGQFGTIDGFSMYGAEWTSQHVPYQVPPYAISIDYNLLADNGLYTSLTAYGLIYQGYIGGFTKDTALAPGQFIYLSYLSVNYEPLVWNGTLGQVLDHTNLIYSNGGSQVYCGPVG